MYIAFETLAGNDPRLDKEIKFITSWWHYTIAEVPDKKYIEWLFPVVLTKEETKADILVSAVNDELNVRKSVAKRGELVGYSFDDEQSDDKIIHILTPQEKAIALSFMKKVLNNFVEKQLSSFKELAWIKKEIESAKSTKELKIIMTQHFDFNSAETKNCPPPTQKLSSWKNPEIVSLPSNK